MKITNVSRPKSQIITKPRHYISSVPVKQEKRPMSFVDESFMNQPIDLRKVNTDQFPDNQKIEDDSTLNVPLAMVVGKRSQTNTANDKNEIEDLKMILQSVQREQRLNNSNKKEYHLSKHLQPPVIERFCPEKYFTEKAINQFSKNRDFQENLKREPVRPFPYDMISSSVNGFNVDIKKRPHRRAKPTFSEIGEHEIRDFFF